MAHDESRQQPQVMITHDQFAREQLARDMEALKKNPMDQASQPGGVFMGTDGELHDAHGNKIGKSAGKSGEKSAGKSAGKSDASDEDVEGMTVAELQDEADARGVEVEGTGSGGRVTKADLVAALSK